MFRGLGCLLAVLFAVSALPAQEGVPPDVRALADSLRRFAVCPTDVPWPDLPDSGWPVFSIDPADFADSADIARPDITVPQYAFFYRPSDGICEPVVVVQAQGEFLGHITVSDQTGGSAFGLMYDLLGTDRPTKEGQGFARSTLHFRFIFASTSDSEESRDAEADATPEYSQATYEYQHALFWEYRSQAERHLP